MSENLRTENKNSVMLLPNATYQSTAFELIVIDRNSVTLKTGTFLVRLVRMNLDYCIRISSSLQDESHTVATPWYFAKWLTVFLGVRRHPSAEPSPSDAVFGLHPKAEHPSWSEWRDDGRCQGVVRGQVPKRRFVVCVCSTSRNMLRS